MTLLAFDTETTGKWDFSKKLKFRDREQPKLVQLAAILFDDDFQEISSLNCIIYPSYWEIPEEAAGIHGISTEKAQKFGVSLPSAVEMFQQMAETADRFLAHNIEFDANIMRHAGFTVNDENDPFGTKQQLCSMKAGVNVVKAAWPSGKGKGYKFPSLKESVKHFFDRDIEGAHDALVDVRECVNVYKALCEHYGMNP